MKGAVLHGPGDVRFEEIAEPHPGPGEIVVRTLAAFTCGTDLKVVRRGYHAKMLRPPCVFGHEGAGEVVAVGDGVTSFRPGDRVVAANSAPCGACRSCARARFSLCEDLVFWNGTFADAFKVPARVVEKNVLRLDGVRPEDAAMTEPLACCVKGVDEAGVRAKDRVLVIGAGSIGLMLARLSVLRGAIVTAAARRTDALDGMRRQGASETTKIAQIDGRSALEGVDDARFDVVFDAGGARETADLAVRSAGVGGVVSLFAGCPAGSTIELDVTRVHYEETRIIGSFHHTPDSFREAFRLIRSGDVKPDHFITARTALRDLPAALVSPPPGTLKTLVTF